QLRTGRGQKVETSLLHALAAYDLLGSILWQLGLDTTRVGTDIPRGEYLTAMTKDGVWVQCANNRPRLFRAFAEAAGLAHLYDDPDFAGLPRLTDTAARLRLWEILLETVRRKTWPEWQEILAGNMDLSIEPFRTTQEGMDHPQVRHNGHVIRVEVEGLGETEHVAPLVKL